MDAFFKDVTKLFVKGDVLIYVVFRPVFEQFKKSLGQDVTNLFDPRGVLGKLP